MEGRVVYGVVAVVSLVGTIIGVACTEYSEEPRVAPPERDSGPVDAAPDASAPGTGDAGDDDEAAIAACMAACTGEDRACDGGTCHVTCSSARRCTSGTNPCPAGIPCVLDCVESLACDGPTCGDASACAYRCPRKDSCRNTTCGNAETCTYDCNNENSCRQVSCGKAQACTIDCTGSNNACRDGIECPVRVDSTCAVNCAVDGCLSLGVACCAGATCTITGSGATTTDAACP